MATRKKKEISTNGNNYYLVHLTKELYQRDRTWDMPRKMPKLVARVHPLGAKQKVSLILLPSRQEKQIWASRNDGVSVQPTFIKG